MIKINLIPKKDEPHIIVRSYHQHIDLTELFKRVTLLELKIKRLEQR